MCKSIADGGQRCATRAREGFHRAEAAVLRASLVGDIAAISHANRHWDQAAAVYASTPEGMVTLADRAARYEAHGDHTAAAMFRAALRRGATLRAANTEAATQVRARRAATPEGGCPGDDPCHQATTAP